MKITTLIIFAFIYFSSFGQTVINGIVLDEKTPFPFVKVYLNNHKIGTLTNFEGKFELDNKSLPFSEKDTFIIESNGFETEYIPFQSGKVFYEVNLQKKITQLNEIVVGPLYPLTREINKFEKESELNHKGTVIQPFQENSVFIENKMKEIGWIKNVSIYCSFFINPKAPFRVNLYSVNFKTGFPDKSLLTANVVLYPTIKEGWQKINLEPYKIELPKNGFFVSIEALPFEGVYVRPMKDTISDNKRLISNEPLTLGSYDNEEIINRNYYRSIKETINFSQGSVNKWYKSRASQIGLKVELEVLSKTKILQETQLVDSTKLILTKKETKKLNIPKVNYSELPQSTVKELFESSVKAYNSNQTSYWISHLVLFNEEYKNDFIEILKEIQLQESDKNSSRTNQKSDKLIFTQIEKLLLNLDAYPLIENENGTFELQTESGNFPLSFMNNKWYINLSTSTIETKTEIKYSNYNFEENE
jgi:hypothetical protein